MRGGEGVVDPDVAELGEFGDERRIVLLFLFMEAGVLKAEDVAVLHRRDSLFGSVADAIVGERDRPAEHFRQFRRDRFQRLLGVAALGPAEMRQQDHLAALVRDFRDRRRHALQPRGVGDAALLHGDVEIDAQQHALSLDVDVIESAEGVCHGWCPGRGAA